MCRVAVANCGTDRARRISSHYASHEAATYAASHLKIVRGFELHPSHELASNGVASQDRRSIRKERGHILRAGAAIWRRRSHGVSVSEAQTRTRQRETRRADWCE